MCVCVCVCVYLCMYVSTYVITTTTTTTVEKVPTGLRAETFKEEDICKTKSG